MKTKVLKLFLILFIMVIDLLLLVRVTYFRYYEAAEPTLIKATIKDNKMIISFNTNEQQLNNKVYCTIKDNDEVPKITDNSWILSKNNQCSFEINKNTYKAYLKSSDNKIIFVDDSDKLGNITKLEINKNKIYLALSDTYTPTLTIDYVGNINSKVIWTSNNNKIANVDENGKIEGISKGETKITAKVMNKEVFIDVIVTDLIVKKPKEFSNKKLIAFTFDDGPSYIGTNKLLDNLDKYNARVTFFVLGSRVENYKDTLTKAYKMGNTIGNHTYSHSNLLKLDNYSVMDEIKKTNETIKNITGSETIYLRPPYGNINSDIKNISNMYTILWDLDTEDWKNKDKDRIADYIVSNAHDGSIVLLHDLYETSVDGALLAMERLEKEGYAFVTIDEMINYFLGCDYNE